MARCTRVANKRKHARRLERDALASEQCRPTLSPIFASPPRARRRLGLAGTRLIFRCGQDKRHRRTAPFAIGKFDVATMLLSDVPDQ